MRLIDADALKKTLEKLWNIHDDDDFANKDVWREIENAPTIEPERTVKAEQYDWNVWFCSNCNHDIGWKDKYCRGCGARLDWSEHETDRC